MKALKNKSFRILGLAMVMAVCAIGFAFAADFSTVVAPIIKLLQSLLGPLIAVVGAAGSLYCILLGVKYARAEEPQDREKAKQHLKSAIIGFILIFVLIVVLNLLMSPLQQWVNESAGININTQVTDTSGTTSGAATSTTTTSGTTTSGAAPTIGDTTTVVS